MKEAREREQQNRELFPVKDNAIYRSSSQPASAASTPPYDFSHRLPLSSHPYEALRTHQASPRPPAYYADTYPSRAGSSRGRYDGHVERMHPYASPVWGPASPAPSHHVDSPHSKEDVCRELDSRDPVSGHGQGVSSPAIPSRKYFREGARGFDTDWDVDHCGRANYLQAPNGSQAPHQQYHAGKEY